MYLICGLFNGEIIFVLEAVSVSIQICQEEQGSLTGFLSTRGSSLTFGLSMSDIRVTYRKIYNEHNV